MDIPKASFSAPLPVFPMIRRRGYPVFDPSAPLSVLYRTILSQSILALKRPSIGKPFHQTWVTARRPLDFTASRPVCRLTRVRRGRGAKRGELRGAARAGQGSASGARGVRLQHFRRTPPLGRGLWSHKGAGWFRLMHGWYGHDAGPSGGRLRVLSGIQAPWQVQLQACLPGSR